MWNRTLCVENMSLQSPLKQAGVEASRFHVIDNFYHGIQHILQRNKQSSASKRTSVNNTEFEFYFRSNFLNFFWKPERDPIIVGAPWVQTPHNIFTATLQNQSKKVYFSRTPALVACSSSQNRNSALMSPEWIYLTKKSNWAHEVTFVKSSTWKGNIGDAFISSF